MEVHHGENLGNSKAAAQPTETGIQDPFKQLREHICHENLGEQLADAGTEKHTTRVETRDPYSTFNLGLTPGDSLLPTLEPVEEPVQQPMYIPIQKPRITKDIYIRRLILA